MEASPEVPPPIRTAVNGVNPVLMWRQLAMVGREPPDYGEGAFMRQVRLQNGGRKTGGFNIMFRSIC